jgi:glycosyltransferase involved in cell wall biosynthesis
VNIQNVKSRAESDGKLDGGFGSVNPRIAVLIPCYNEELTIADVVSQFRAELPDAEIYVFDNNSTDRTVAEAAAAGARIFHEKRQGKGYVVQSMFRKISADVYVMVDGDGTYPAPEVHRLIEPILTDEADIVIGSRLHREANSQFKTRNRLGNRFFLYVLNYTLGASITDMLSGYRAFNRAFVKGVPLFGGGFETETELTIKALNRGFRIVEVPVNLTTRPEGSFSKIRIFRDGFLILNTLLALFRDYKPLTFFGGVGLFIIALGLIPSVMVIYEFIGTGRVLRLPAVVLAVGLILCGLLSITVGLILHTIVRRSQELDHQLRTLTDDLRLQLEVALNRDAESEDR